MLLYIFYVANPSTKIGQRDARADEHERVIHVVDKETDHGTLAERAVADVNQTRQQGHAQTDLDALNDGGNAEERTEVQKKQTTMQQKRNGYQHSILVHYKSSKVY